MNDIDMIDEFNANDIGRDEQEFLDNISWDTESDEQDIQMDDELLKIYLQ